MDLSINKAVKDFMRKKFMEWYSAQVMDKMAMEDKDKETTSIDFKLTTMKPLITNWLIRLFDYLTTNTSILTNGFKAAGIEETLSSTVAIDLT